MKSRLRVIFIVVALLLGVVGSVFAENIASKVFGSMATSHLSSNLSSLVGTIGSGGY